MQNDAHRFPIYIKKERKKDSCCYYYYYYDDDNSRSSRRSFCRFSLGFHWQTAGVVVSIPRGFDYKRGGLGEQTRGVGKENRVGMGLGKPA